MSSSHNDIGGSQPPATSWPRASSSRWVYLSAPVDRKGSIPLSASGVEGFYFLLPAALVMNIIDAPWGSIEILRVLINAMYFCHAGFMGIIKKKTRAARIITYLGSPA